MKTFVIEQDILALLESFATDPLAGDHSLDGVIRWLSRQEPTRPNTLSDFIDPMRLAHESLQLALLQKLHQFYTVDDENQLAPASTEPVTWWRSIVLALIAIAGTIWSICDGFDSFASILTLFVGLPYWSIFIIGFTMALIPVMFFYGFDFAEIAKILNVPLYHSKKTLDIFVQQAMLIKQFRKDIKSQLRELQKKLPLTPHDARINELYPLFNLPKQLQPSIEQHIETVSDSDKASIIKLICLLDMLLARQRALQCARVVYQSEYERIHEQLYLKIAKTAMATMTGLFYFCCGFFAGQTLAMAVLTVFLSATLTTTSWPIVLMSVLVGLTALSIYWVVERVNVENLVERCIGMDIEMIEQLPDETVTIKREDKQTQLKMDIHRRFLLLGNSVFVDKQSMLDASLLRIKLD